MVSSSFAFAQYPGIIQGMVFGETDFAKINAASLDIGGIKVKVIKGVGYVVTSSAGTFYITGNGVTTKKPKK